jgi:hypothetical protein
MLEVLVDFLIFGGMILIPFVVLAAGVGLIKLIDKLLD